MNIENRVTRADLEAHSGQSTGCCPFAEGRLPQITEPPEEDMPGNLASRAWRDLCMEGKAHIPAGYTYLSQLIGHDAGLSLPLMQTPYAARRHAAKTAGNMRLQRAKRYNLIENPLTLETLYGTGPMLLPHLFDAETWRFRVRKNFLVSVPLDPTDASLRALYDSRNRDTTMLHRLTVIWMKFHNHISEEIVAQAGLSARQEKRRAREVYAMARAHVVEVWHRLIRQDVLPRFVDPSVVGIHRSGLPSLDETTLLHGVFRAFHALPRSKYNFGHETRQMRSLLLKGARDNEAVVNSWRLDWTKFFTDAPDGTKTGITASFSPALPRFRGRHLSDLDAERAVEMDPLRLGSPDIKRLVAALSPQDQAALDPQAMSDLAKERLDGREIAARTILHGPLFFTLMLEAQLHGKEGRFGPLGSLMLLHALEDLMTDVVVTETIPGALTRPDTMMELINYVGQRERT